MVQVSGSPLHQEECELTAPPLADRATSLQTLLQALLISYTSLISALLAPPPSLPTLPPPGPNGELPPTEPERLVEHIRIISSNMHHLVNELRPVQVRAICLRHPGTEY